MKLCPQCDTGYADSHITCPTHGVMLGEIRELRPGMLVRNTYRIIRKLGEGGMGAVYLAEHTLMRERQALKFLSPELSHDEAFTSRFSREVRTLRQIRHKNVVDAGNLEPAEDGTLFFSMEFVDGPDLRDFLDAAPKPFDVGLALDITRGIAEGLAAAHAQGVVHRDIKPENILLARTGDAWTPKIADFGIVATKESSSLYTKTGGTLLTMAYAAPEQWRGMRAAELDGRTDLYALGGVLYEMLTGQTAFEAESYEGWAERHRNSMPMQPRSLRPELARWMGLDALVLRLLSKNRDQRPRGAQELASLLDSVKQAAPVNRPVATREEIRVGAAGSPTGGIWKPNKRIVLFASAAAILLAAFVSAVPIITRHFGRPEPALLQRAQALFAEKRYSEAAPLFDGNCAAGDAAACATLGYMYEKGDGVAQDGARAMAIDSKACDGGNAVGCSNLANFYYSGYVVKRDVSRAATLESRACDAGYAPGCTQIGSFYERGVGVSSDPERAAQLYGKACDGGDGLGCRYLGLLYYDSKWLPQDTDMERRSFIKGCTLGDADTCDFLGEIYMDGKGIGKDPVKAREFYGESCDMGNGWACGTLADIYRKGDGVRKDLELARKLYAEACEGKDGTAEGSACDYLGRAYLSGDGVEKDRAKAKDYFVKACSSAHTDSCYEAKKLD